MSIYGRTAERRERERERNRGRSFERAKVTNFIVTFSSPLRRGRFVSPQEKYGKLVIAVKKRGRGWTGQTSPVYKPSKVKVFELH